MKVYYFNDESLSVQVRLIDRNGNNTFHRLPAHTGETFTVDVPADRKAIPFIKRWNDYTILISYMIESNNEV